MSVPVVVPPAGGEIVGDAADRRVEILAEHDALHATWSRFGPGRDGADRHIHRGHTDLFCVLGGVLTVKLGTGDDEVEVPAGTLAGPARRRRRPRWSRSARRGAQPADASAGR